MQEGGGEIKIKDGRAKFLQLWPHGAKGARQRQPGEGPEQQDDHSDLMDLASLPSFASSLLEVNKAIARAKAKGKPGRGPANQALKRDQGDPVCQEHESASDGLVSESGSDSSLGSDNELDLEGRAELQEVLQQARQLRRLAAAAGPAPKRRRKANDDSGAGPSMEVGGGGGPASSTEAPASSSAPVATWQELKAGTFILMEGPPGSRKLARESLVRAGTSTEAVSVYCYLHGCSRMVKASRCPSRAEITRWVLSGLALPTGKDGKHAHQQLWAEHLMASGAKMWA